MKLFSKILLVLFVVVMAVPAFAENYVIISGIEWGVGKFHRKDNTVHPYGPTNSWSLSILPDKAEQHPLVYKTAENMYTIQYFTLEELLKETIKIVQATNSKILVFNVHAHGLPGAMWFPHNNRALSGFACASWRESAQGADSINYNQYYSPIPKDEILEIRASADSTAHYGCTTGVQQWEQVVTSLGGLKQYFTPNSVVNFLSCVVGLGAAGDNFTRGIANLLLPAGGKGMVRTSMNFGLGDWSMDKGMGFWDYVTDEQLEKDNAIYPKTKRDADIAQNGQMRVATVPAEGQVQSFILADQPFMVFSTAPGMTKAMRGLPGRVFPSAPVNFRNGSYAPQMLKVPGTQFRVIREQ